MRLLSIVLLYTLTTGWGFADYAPSIKFNPFAYTEEKKASSNRKANDASEKKAIVKPKPWRPRLIATIAAGESSLANVAGKVVKIGQEIDGYKLLSVDRKSATFEKGGNKYVLKMVKKTKFK